MIIRSDNGNELRPRRRRTRIINVSNMLTSTVKCFTKRLLIKRKASFINLEKEDGPLNA